MPSEPLIDLMMPFYGDTSLLRDAVRSVLGQSSPDWRLTVVDDCDPDPDAGAWVTALDHPRVTYVRNEHRLGVAANFRRCLELASSPYVTFMGCDDLMGVDYVALMSEAIQCNPRAAAIHPRVRVIDEAGRDSGAMADRVKRLLTPRAGTPLTLKGEQLAAQLLHGNWAYFPAICWRRDLVTQHPFRADMETVLDLDLLLNLVFDGHEVVLIPDQAFSYRRHHRSASSLTARDARRFDEEARLFQEVASLCVERGWRRAGRAARWHVTSRLHAAALVPTTLLAQSWGTSGRLLTHAFGRH